MMVSAEQPEAQLYTALMAKIVTNRNALACAAYDHTHSYTIQRRCDGTDSPSDLLCSYLTVEKQGALVNAAYHKKLRQDGLGMETLQNMRISGIKMNDAIPTEAAPAINPER